MTATMQHNAHKFAYLVKAYPEKTVQKVIELFQLSPIDINCAVWTAIHLGLIAPMSEAEPYAKLLKEPAKWNFGPKEAELEESLTYAFQKINAEEKDMEENYLSHWTVGYAPQDVLIATKRLLETGVLHEYEIEDGENLYIFYTLKKNEGKNWGAKQFKVNPLTGEKNSTEAPSEA